MRSLLILTLLFAVIPAVSAQEAPVSRREGFQLIWEGIKRPAQDVRSSHFTDVSEGSPGFREIQFAVYRGLLDDDTELFRPDAPLTIEDAVLWLFRTRNLEPLDFEHETGLMEIIEREQLPLVLARYPIASLADPNTTVSREDLSQLARSLNSKLTAEEHEISSYSEKFHGKGTGFGETFDMHAMTAAHRTFPHNTMVRVTNVANGKSVTVRINDRGPFVFGRNMDLSLAAFLAIEERSKGIAQARFERLGDVSLLDLCKDDRTYRRITPSLILSAGVPRLMKLGDPLTLRAEEFFVVRSVRFPDGFVQREEQWISPEESYEFRPDVPGTYTFLLSSKEGKQRSFEMQANHCE